MNIINITEQYTEEGGLQYFCGSAAVSFIHITVHTGYQSDSMHHSCGPCTPPVDHAHQLSAQTSFCRTVFVKHKKKRHLTIQKL